MWHYIAVCSFNPIKKPIQLLSLLINLRALTRESHPNATLNNELGTTELAPGWLEPDTRSINLLPCPLTEFTEWK